MEELLYLRKKVDEVDNKILLALRERIRVCKEIGLAKKKQGVPIKDSDRESEVFKRIKEKSVQFGLDSGQVEAVYREIVNMCSVVQE